MQKSCPIPTPGQLRVWMRVHVAGAKLALITGVAPVPVNVTGDPVTATLAVMVNVPFAGPTAVGGNVTVIVQVEGGANVAPQLPPAREYSVGANTSVMPVRLAVPVLCSVRVREALVVPDPTLPKASGPPV